MKSTRKNKAFSKSLLKGYLIFGVIGTFIIGLSSAKAGFWDNIIESIKTNFSKTYTTSSNKDLYGTYYEDDFILTSTSKNTVDKETPIDRINLEDGALASAVGPLRTSTDEELKNEFIQVYEVKNGDTVADVAKLFDVSKNTITWANDIKDNKLKPGDILIILPVNGVKHTVKKGDTLADLAKKYKADKQDIVEFNSIKNEELSIGDEIIIPDGSMFFDAPVKKDSPKTTTPKKPKIYASSGAGYFTRPVIGGIKTQGIHGHNGVDIGIPVGSALLAAADGVVQVAKQGGYNGGYGSMIIISHPNGTQTVYGHLTDVYVSTGQTVSKGEQIGTTGNSGRSSGPHLHFEVRGASNPF